MWDITLPSPSIEWELSLCKSQILFSVFQTNKLAYWQCYVLYLAATINVAEH